MCLPLESSWYCHQPLRSRSEKPLFHMNLPVFSHKYAQGIKLQTLSLSRIHTQLLEKSRTRYAGFRVNSWINTMFGHSGEWKVRSCPLKHTHPRTIEHRSSKAQNTNAAIVCIFQHTTNQPIIQSVRRSLSAHMAQCRTHPARCICFIGRQTSSAPRV